MLGKLTELGRWFHDPPPGLILEISESSVSLARLGKNSRLPEIMAISRLAEGAVDPSPIRENVHKAEDLDRALREVIAQASANGAPLRNKDAAVLLPDNCARVTVLDFETLPADANERLALIRWRLKKAVPFDVDTAALSYQVQRDGEKVNSSKQGGPSLISVLVVVSPSEVITQYEAAVQRAGLVPGYVSVSLAAALNLVVEHGVTMLAKLAGHTLSLVVIDQGRVRLVRSLEAGTTQEETAATTAAAPLVPPLPQEAPLPETTAPDKYARETTQAVTGLVLSEERLKEMAADLYPTFVYVADNFGAPISKLVLAGFGAAFPLAADVFRRELGHQAEPLQGPQGIVEPHNAGIWGFLSGN